MSYSRSGIRSKGLVYMIYQKKGRDAEQGVGSKIHEIPKEGNAVESAFMEICKHNKSNLCLSQGLEN